MTDAQQRAFDREWRRWGLDYAAEALDLDATFGADTPRVLEIGFGMGQSLADMAAASPETGFIGIEVHRPGVGRLLHLLAEQGLGNVRVFCHDAVEVLRDCIAAEALDAVQIFFPDPWHKKRHHKRRLIQPDFVDLVASRLRPGGRLHLATDWEPYAEQMLEVLSDNPLLQNTAENGGFVPRPESRPLTRFEQRGTRLGHGVRDLVFTRRQGMAS
ncbi:tRNA (guanosine(46)-N7)-methyltransferase TrmB [Chromatocurvus halotolerans]|nr:tRNA (guanosine(46)-N7)-methyltransferase TrmB [Chromatocurvus halotolerans]